MRLVEHELEAGVSHASETWTATLTSLDRTTVIASLSLAASLADVSGGLNRYFIANTGGGTYDATASIDETVDGWIRYDNLHVVGQPDVILWGRVSPGVATSLAVDHHYGNDEDISMLIGALNALVGLDRDDDGIEDPGVRDFAGELADGYIDLELQEEGLTAPADVSNTSRYRQFNDVWMHLGVWYVWHARGLVELSSRFGPDKLAGMMSGYKEYADAQLEKLVNVLSMDEADEASTLPAMQAIVPAREQWCGPWGYG